MPSPLHRAASAGALALVALAASLGTTVATAAAPEPEQAAIVNGTQVSEPEFASKWPFVVAIVAAGADTQYDGQFCGGSLVDDQHVVTAAHCLTFEPGLVSAASGVRVVAKTRALSQSALGSGETGARAVSEIFLHPDFAENDGEGFRSDVAVLRLAQPIAGAATVPLVQAGEGALWRDGAGGVDAYAAGWGDTDPRDERNPELKFPSLLRQTTVPLQSDARCASTVGGGYGTAFERATNLCGGTLRSRAGLGTDSCQGDSGGPLTVAAGDGTWRLVGITSWGEGCADRKFGAYARVAALRGWIESVPGATDGGPALGGPGGTLSIGNLRRVAHDYRSVRLAWDAPVGGTAPERYAIWRRTLVDGDRGEELVGITTSTSYRARVRPARRANAYVWNVRPLDAGGSNGPSATVKAGPRPDTVAPGVVRVSLVRARRGALHVRWTAAPDRQSGVDAYQVQRRIVGRSGFATVDVTAGRTAFIDGLPRGARVQVRVRAADRAGNTGRWSAAASFRTLG